MSMFICTDMCIYIICVYTPLNNSTISIVKAKPPRFAFQQISFRQTRKQYLYTSKGKIIFKCNKITFHSQGSIIFV